MRLQAAVVHDTVPGVEGHHTGFVVVDYTNFEVAEAVVVFGLLVKDFHRRRRTLFHLLPDCDS
jgi:hypothetical protein